MITDSCAQMKAVEISAAYWPAKAELSIQIEEPESYAYDGTSKYPMVNKVVSGNTELSAETNYEVVLSKNELEESISSFYNK